MNGALPPLREIIARHNLAAKKSLGQHFLLDLNLTRKIARAACIGPGDRVFEVGPGPGGLTRALLEAGAHVFAIERDARCLDALEDLGEAYPGKLEIMNADALAVDERAILGPGPVKICANLPYNISTELLIKWLRVNHAPDGRLWDSMTLMFQKEVAERIVAAPGSKTYGRLSVIAQAAALTRRAFDIPARAFTPPPKVDSTVVVFEPTDQRIETLGALERVTQAAFGQRRKMLRSSLRPAFGDKVEAELADSGIAPTSRAEDVPVAAFLKLAAAFQALSTS